MIYMVMENGEKGFEITALEGKHDFISITQRVKVAPEAKIEKQKGLTSSYEAYGT